MTGQQISRRRASNSASVSTRKARGRTRSSPSEQPDAFAGPLASLGAALREIQSSIAYILKELPGLDIDAGLRERVSRTCEAMDVSLRFDVASEVRNLVAKLYPASGQLDPGQDPDPRVTLELIRRWVWSDLMDYDALARSLPAGAQADDQSALSVLLLESGGNMFTVWGRLRGTLATIETLVDQDERWRGA